MKVLIVNTTERTGGAAIAASRLMHALQNEGVEVSMRTRSNGLSIFNFQFSTFNFYWERLRIFLANRLSMQNLWLVDIANCGEDITQTREFQEADVVHLHWVNQGFLSLKVLERIFQSGKRIIWTMHDQWSYAGICHYTEDCDHFQTHCHDCPRLIHPTHKDLSYKVFEAKKHIWEHADITFVGCSQWIAEEARKSLLTQGKRIVSIPNAIDHSIFRPIPKDKARAAFGLPTDKRLIFFSCQKISDERKGMRYLLKALAQLQGDDIGLVVAGATPSFVGGEAIATPLFSVGYIDSEQRMAQLYAAADVFVTPSLQDNLPNTIVEAMSCGTPCVGFHVGGIPEMIHHQKDGYVARYCDSGDLAEGIRYVLDHPELQQAAVNYAHETYNERRVAQLYIKEYER